MSTIFDQLPPELYKALNRWYTISAVACCITLLTLSYVHVTTTLKLTQVTQEHPELAQTTDQSLSTPEQEAALTASENELKKLAEHHQLFFKLFGAILSSVPHHVQLTHFVIEPDKQIACKGLANTMDEVTQFMRSLQEKIQLNITELDLQEPSPSMLSFSLRARLLL